MSQQQKDKQFKVDYSPHRVRVAGAKPRGVVSIVTREVAVVREAAQVHEIQSENVAREIAFT